MQPFEYHVPSTVAEVKSLNRGEAKLMAGGQSLLGAMKLGLASPTDIVDLRKVAALKGISVDDGVLTIGAMVTHAEVASSSDVRHAIAALADLAEHIGDRQVRHRALWAAVSQTMIQRLATLRRCLRSMRPSLLTGARSLPPRFLWGSTKRPWNRVN